MEAMEPNVLSNHVLVKLNLAFELIVPSSF